MDHQEIGLLRPNGLYIQCVAADEETALAGHPDGTIVVPLRPSPDHIWSGTGWTSVARPPEVPASVTRAQAIVALHEAGLLPAVEAAVAAHPYEIVRLWWANALTFDRGNTYLAGLALELDLTEAQVDALFIDAATRI